MQYHTIPYNTGQYDTVRVHAIVITFNMITKGCCYTDTDTDTDNDHHRDNFKMKFNGVNMIRRGGATLTKGVFATLTESSFSG